MANDKRLYAPLAEGGTIGVMAPSSYIEKEDITKSVAHLKQLGYDVYVHPQTYLRHNQSAGTHTDKLNALHALYTDPNIKLIWAAGGGNRALHILDDIDYELIKHNPKPLIGFSDVTALLNNIYIKTGFIGYHGPVFKQLYKHQHTEHALNLLKGDLEANRIELSESKCLKAGTASGTLIGGNLSLIQYMTAPLISSTHKKYIILLEDCSEELSRIDRMLLHLKRSGLFSIASGLVFGEFTDIKDSSRPFGFKLDEIILEHTQDFNGPILINAPFGHSAKLYSARIGGNCDLNSEKNTLLMHC